MNWFSTEELCHWWFLTDIDRGGMDKCWLYYFFDIFTRNLIHEDLITLYTIVKNNSFLQETSEKTVMDVMNCTSKLI